MQRKAPVCVRGCRLAESMKAADEGRMGQERSSEGLQLAGQASQLAADSEVAMPLSQLARSQAEGASAE